MRIAPLKLLLLAAALACPHVFLNSASAQEFKSPAECVPDLKVQHRNGQQGVVVKNEDGSCRVRLPDGKVESWLFWMTRPAGASALTSDKLVVGKYQCYSGSNYLFMDIHIKNKNTYADGTGKTGSYKLDPSTNKISFLSGPLKGAGSMLMDGPRIGLNFNQSNFYNTTCSLARG